VFRKDAIKEIIKRSRIDGGSKGANDIKSAERFYMGEFESVRKMESNDEEIPIPFSNMTVESAWGDVYFLIHLNVINTKWGLIANCAAFTDNEISGVCFLHVNNNMLTCKIPQEFHTVALKNDKKKIERSNLVGNHIREMLHIIDKSEKEVIISDTKRKLKGSKKHVLKRTKYTIVKINKKYLSKKGSGTHASPCLHSRRGHWRTLKDKKVWVRECTVGDSSKGEVKKHYVI